MHMIDRAIRLNSDELNPMPLFLSPSPEVLHIFRMILPGHIPCPASAGKKLWLYIDIL